MAELRWALLLAGILLVAGLVLWDKRKRQTRDAGRGTLGAGGAASNGAGPGVSPGAHGQSGQPGPGIASDSSGPASWASREEPAFSMPDLPRREPMRDLPIVEIDPRSADDPRVGDLPVFRMEEGARPDAPGLGDRGPSPAGGAPAAQEPEVDAAVARDAAGGDPVERASAWLADSIPGESPQTVVLDWPPEDQRRIVALRVVPRAGERFTGAALRQALVGEGFVHGELDIYHKPLGDGRALLSAASLTRPGTFDPTTIDGLLFAGLNLFTVMPGPLPPRETVERLLLAGRTLAQRLRGEALDSRGQPLTDARIAELRREAVEGTP